MVVLCPTLESHTADLDAIFNHYVENTVMTFATTPISDDEAYAKYRSVKDSGLPYIVAPDSDDNSNPIGYIYATPYRGDCGGYVHSVEMSMFCHPQHVGKGAGTALLTRFLEVLREPERFGDNWLGGQRREPERRVCKIIAIMALDEDSRDGGLGSKKFYERFGFEEVGRLRGVGRKFGRWVDALYLQLSI
ncbi:hypothetical protein AAF712_008628 [Marasmius tenuissimus]|uniref:N-acetyltransferase domain-containing protein n=1 Tax=Marasmius tenuissimus TaxID=585030 RepID=A0ABR2ZUF3_9AGAR